MKQIIYILMLLFTLFSVYANPAWLHEANAGTYINSPTTGGSFSGYASNFANPFSSSNATWNICYMPSGSLFTPVVQNFIGTASAEIITTPTTTNIQILDMDCTVLKEINFINEYVTAMPIITNYDNDDKGDIAVLTNNSLNFYELDAITQEFIIVKEIYYKNYSSQIEPILFDCFFGDPQNVFCIALGQRMSIFFNITNNSIKNNTDVLSLAINMNSTGFGGAGIAGTATSGISGNWYMPSCHITQAGNTAIDCKILNATGETKTSYVLGGGGGALGVIKQSSSYIAKIGNVFRVLSWARVNGNYGISGIYDLNGDRVYKGQTDTNTSVSQWVVGDWNKDGYNDGCQIVNNVAENDTDLNCLQYDGYISSTEINASVRINATNFVMADFNSSSAFLCIGTVEGIFCHNGGTGFYETIFTTGYNANIRNKGFPITTWTDGVQSPGLIYADTVGGFIVRNTINTILCGNLVCDATETQFSCPGDCLIVGGTGTVGDPCNDSSVCQSGKCDTLNNVCVLLGDGEACTLDSQCYSGDCKASGICAKTTLWKSIDNGKTENFGDDNETNNFIALIIMMAVSIFMILGGIKAGMPAVGFVSGIVSFIIIGAYFTFFAHWLSGFIFFIILIGYIGAVSIMILISRG